ncbi:hexitol phosphatase HxpB [Aurantibacillus circumpalustris]|uniref:hexitol phosphatase HxpB n=1 Tax=Aurantibacillus circumpalustris TaxID=3036359 RepID=UPI00295C24BB|nr:hexitol phosphatase HxpB [Aurantibacillus circumpalustris]
MLGSIKAVIFDMDGVLIESEHLWRKAMIIGFKEYGITLSEADCRKTMGLRIGEVINLWLVHFKLTEISTKQLENRIIELLLSLIEESGTFMQGIPALIAYCRQKKLKLGLATSSSVLLMNAVLKKLDLTNEFDAALSAEFLPYGKPHPQVFLMCAEKLEIAPQECLVIEDSLNGVIAAKAAQMKVIAVPDEEHTSIQGFAVADYKRDTMHDVLALFKTILS